MQPIHCIKINAYGQIWLKKAYCFDTTNQKFKKQKI